MDLKKAKELAGRILKVGVNRVYIDPSNLKKVEDAMTKDDVRGLIAERIIKKRKTNYQSRGRSRVATLQRQKGRRRGKGKRRGTKNTRVDKKSNWMHKVRAQRNMLQELKKTNPKAVEEKGYGNIYKKIKGNFFKGKNYLKEYVEGVKK
ncbi:MAG TPA: 50S ribosomal protein L19e [archaeon]|nr:50S ribosomal protein L19e [archaeon]